MSKYDYSEFLIHNEMERDELLKSLAKVGYTANQNVYSSDDFPFYVHTWTVIEDYGYSITRNPTPVDSLRSCDVTRRDVYETILEIHNEDSPVFADFDLDKAKDGTDLVTVLGKPVTVYNWDVSGQILGSYNENGEEIVHTWDYMGNSTMNGSVLTALKLMTYPTTSMSGDELYDIYMECDGSIHECLLDVANAAIKQYILSNQ